MAADITNVVVTPDEGTLLKGGTGTCDPEGLVLICNGTRTSDPSQGSAYTINLSSGDSYGQPFDDYNCTSFDAETGVGTSTVQG